VEQAAEAADVGARPLEGVDLAGEPVGADPVVVRVGDELAAGLNAAEVADGPERQRHTRPQAPDAPVVGQHGGGHTAASTTTSSRPGVLAQEVAHRLGRERRAVARGQHVGDQGSGPPSPRACSAGGVTGPSPL
jgi:hypothetical protein